MIGSMIAESATLATGYMDRLLTDVNANQFARFATVNGKAIESNHPAFILGHLSLYPCRVLNDLGLDSSAIEPSEKYEALFSPSAKCMDDPDGTLYPAMDEIVACFKTTHQAAIEALQSADDSFFAQPNPNERMQAKFSTIGSMHAFYMGGHLMVHVGQFSAWRRAMGLGSV